MAVQRRERETLRAHLGKEEGIREGMVVEMAFELNLLIHHLIKCNIFSRSYFK